MAQSFRIAALVTAFFPNSHAGVLVSKFLTGFPTDGGLVPPRTRIASLYIDQIHRHDIGLQLAHRYGVPVYGSIRAALTLGGDELAVDGVLLIGEHGDYPRTALGQEMLPRRWFFEQVCGVIAEQRRPLPVFVDKHLSYRWSDARWMYDTARELEVPLWAGSSLPVHWRSPEFEHPRGTPLDAALSTGFHMLERYGFHALEALQCQVERRAAGETGVGAVTCLTGDDVWRAADAGRWPTDLADAALEATFRAPVRLEPGRVSDPHVFLVDYADGLRAAALMLGDDGYVERFAYAGRRGEGIDAFAFQPDPSPNKAHFSYFGLNVEDFLLSGRPSSPVERTLLTTGILEAAMLSHHRGGERVATPHLDIAYAPGTHRVRRPTGPPPNAASATAVPLPEPGATPAAKPIPIDRDGTVRPAPSARTSS